MDNPHALVQRHDAASREVTFNGRFLAFAKNWGFRQRASAPFGTRTKGKTENGAGYVKKNVIAGGSARSPTRASTARPARCLLSASSVTWRIG